MAAGMQGLQSYRGRGVASVHAAQFSATSGAGGHCVLGTVLGPNTSWDRAGPSGDRMGAQRDWSFEAGRPVRPAASVPCVRQGIDSRAPGRCHCRRWRPMVRRRARPPDMVSRRRLEDGLRGCGALARTAASPSSKLPTTPRLSTQIHSPDHCHRPACGPCSISITRPTRSPSRTTTRSAACVAGSFGQVGRWVQDGVTVPGIAERPATTAHSSSPSSVPR